MSPLPTSESSIPKNQGLKFPQAKYNYKHATLPPQVLLPLNSMFICEGYIPSFSMAVYFSKKEKVFWTGSIFSQVYSIAQEHVEVGLQQVMYLFLSHCALMCSPRSPTKLTEGTEFSVQS